MLSSLFQTSAPLRILSFSLAVLIINLCGWQAARAAVRFDYNFAPVLATPSGGLNSALVLPDGKIIVIRLSSQNVLGNQEYKVTRLNADGSIDRIFETAVMGRGDGTLLLQPDGRILVFSGSIFVNGENRGGIVRLNADGTLDTSFNASWVVGSALGGLQSDGRIVAGLAFVYQGIVQSRTVRINTDGSRDLSFTPADSANAVAIQSNGRVISGKTSTPFQGLNPNGTIDTAFNSNLPGSWAFSNVTSIIIQPDDKILVGGADIIRLNTNGTRDDSFATGSVYYQYRVFGMVRQPDGKILVGGSGYYASPSGANMKKRLTRVNVDGTVDNTFDAMTSEEYGFDTLTPLAVRPNGTILVSGILTQNNVTRAGLMSLNPNGTIDQTFTSDLGLVSGSVNLLANQPDGKLMVGGFFTKANGFPAPGLVRLNLDGSTDTGFSYPNQITGTIMAIAFQPDDKILVGGNFRFNNQNNYAVFRLNPNGSIDSSFTPNTFTPPDYPLPGVNGIALQPDGKILIGGIFQNYGNSGRHNFVRLNPNGTVDTTYNITSAGVWKMLVQPGGKVIISGSLTENGVTRTNPRLNTDGSIDPTFNMVTDVGALYAVAPDGRLASSGLFPFGKDQARFVFRLKPDGSRDTSFTPARFFDSVDDIVFQLDGRMIVSRLSGLTRLDGSGSEETLYQPNAGRKLLITNDKNLIVGGIIFSLAGAPRTGIGRFLLASKDYDFDGDNKADISLFRPSVGDWYISRSSDGESFGINFGLQNDLIAPGDFDGDGKTDISVFRPSDGGWYRLNSSNNTFSGLQFGSNGDLPVPGDFDGDGKADITVYRPSAGSWYRLNSSNNQFVGAQFGVAEDKPLVGDFDGDGKSDLAVFRPSNGSWYRINSLSNQFVAAQFGIAEDKPVAADYDGDGKTDIAVFRPSNGSWYRINSRNDSFAAAQFGVAEDKPAPADFDGDGRADLAVFRPSAGTWYLQRSTSGFIGQQYGTNGDIPAPNAFVR